jgi:uncharacterized membrane protein YqiK
MVSSVATIIIIVLALVAIGWLIIRLLSRSYVKTTATTAFVRTGGLRGGRAARPTVVMNGAAWVFGFLHRIKWVSLETMAIEIRHLEDNALITSDPQYVDLEARFFVKIKSDPDNVSIAARTIGGEMVNEASVRRLVEPKINGAVRDVAVTFSLREILERRIDFIHQVQDRLKDDLAENGLALESVSILILRPTLQGQFSTDDILGAQVARANAAVIEEALTEKTRLERQGTLNRARLEADAEREQLSIQEEIDVERAQRTKNIAIVRAAEDTEAKITQEQKREEAERAKILADRALEEERLENERMLSLLREQIQKAEELEKILREEAVALAAEEREAHVFEATAAKLRAAREQIEADRERESALQEAMTIIETAVAQRETELELINTRRETEKRALETRSDLELEVLRMHEMAEAERSIAVSQADVTRTRAEADLDAAKMAAVGERERISASGLADVQVSLERIKVMLEEAEAIRLKMLAEAEGEKARAEALASHDAVGQQLELARLNADTLKAVEIARAQALGEAISGMDMTLFGDATSAQRLLQLVSAAQAGHHVYDALPGTAQAALDNLAARLGTRTPGPVESLLGMIRTHYPNALADNPTLGELADTILAEGSSGPAYDRLRAIADVPALRDLPLSAALALAQAWLGGE